LNNFLIKQCKFFLISKTGKSPFKDVLGSSMVLLPVTQIILRQSWFSQLFWIQ